MHPLDVVCKMFNTKKDFGAGIEKVVQKGWLPIDEKKRRALNMMPGMQMLEGKEQVPQGWLKEGQVVERASSKARQRAINIMNGKNKEGVCEICGKKLVWTANGEQVCPEHGAQKGI